MLLAYADTLTNGAFRISLITIFFGYIPLLLQVKRSIDKSKPKPQN